MPEILKSFYMYSNEISIRYENLPYRKKSSSLIFFYSCIVSFQCCYTIWDSLFLPLIWSYTKNGPKHLFIKKPRKIFKIPFETLSKFVSFKFLNFIDSFIV